MLGSTLGKYRVIERLGRGGMGTVYRAVDETLDRPVALKMLNSGLTDSELERRFRSEAITVASLNHQGIARVYELFPHDDQWVMAMELVGGETFERTIERLGPLPVARATDFCVQALDALGHAHAAGVVHRDLKPANLMIAESGHVKVMDFGIALLAGTERLTGVGLMMGTPAFMAPEQVLAREIDSRADLYAMGVVFYYLLTAKLPYRGDTSISMARSHVESQPDSVKSVRDNVPDWVQAVIDKAMVKDPDYRYQTAAQMADALRAGPHSAPAVAVVRTPMPVQTPADLSMATIPMRAPVPRKQRGLWWIGGGLLATSILIGAFIWRPQGESGSPIAGAALSSPGSGSGTAPGNGTSTSAATGTPPPPVSSNEASGNAAPGARGSVAPAAGATVPAPSPVAARGGSAPVTKPDGSDPYYMFRNVRFITIKGRKVSEQDADISFGSGRVTVTLRKGGLAVVSMPYGEIRNAAFALNKLPKVDPALAAPAPGVDYGGKVRLFLLQTKTSFALVTLDEKTGPEVLKQFEARAGIKVERGPASPQK